jgi:hypothetical protein
MMMELFFFISFLEWRGLPYPTNEEGDIERGK